MPFPKKMTKQSTWLLVTLMAFILGVFQLPSVSRHASVHTKRSAVYNAGDYAENATDWLLLARADQDLFPDRNNYFNFHQFQNARSEDIDGYYRKSEEENYTLGAVKAILRIQDILNTVLYPALSNQRRLPTPNDPSFLRYFQPTQFYAKTVYNVLLRINQAIGNTRHDIMRRNNACPTTPKIDIYYLDPEQPGVLSATGTRCTPWKADELEYMAAAPPAYTFESQDPNVPNGIVLCEQFFKYWRDYDDVLQYQDDISASRFLEFGWPRSQQEPTFIMPFALLHELLHLRRVWDGLIPLHVPGTERGYPTIVDVGVMIQDSDNGYQYGIDTEIVTAYSMYNCWTVNKFGNIYNNDLTNRLDATWPRAWIGPMWNVENYISMMKELYWKAKFNIQQAWLDPPPQNGPHAPPGYNRHIPEIHGYPFFNNVAGDSLDLGRTSPNRPLIEPLTPPEASDPDPDFNLDAGDDCCDTG